MSLAVKYVLSIIATVVLVVHFLFVGLYCSQYISNTPQKIVSISQLYVYPIFHQNWNLFVPIPTNEHCLLVRYQTPSGWTNWLDIMQQECLKRSDYPYSGRDALVLLFSSNLNQFVYRFTDTSKVCVSKPKDNSFKVLNYSVNQYLKTYYHTLSQTPYEMLVVKRNKNEQTAWWIKNLIIN